jgi:hypothetical protein
MSHPAERLQPRSIWPENLLVSDEEQRLANRRRLKRLRAEAERLCQEAAELVRKRNGPL